MQTATMYELADFKGLMEEEDGKMQREEREEIEKERIGKGREEEKRRNQ